MDQVSADRSEPRSGVFPLRQRNVRHVGLEGIAAPIAFQNCDHLIEPLSRILCGWPLATVNANGREPIVKVRHHRNRYVLTGALFKGEIHEESQVSALCSLIVELVQARFAADPSLLCLHCGAVELAGRLAIFPAIRRAGKSTLVARLAAGGARAFADDLLQVAPELARGTALGVSLRLRMPLPERTGPILRRFVATHAGASDGYYQYLDLPKSRHAIFGEEAPIGAFILLERQEVGPASLGRVDGGTMLEVLIKQNVARFSSGRDILRRLEALSLAAPAYLLRYSSLDDAALVLEDAFRDGWPAEPGSAMHSVSLTLPRRPTCSGPLRSNRLSPIERGEARYRRNNAVETRRIADMLFLVAPPSDAIYSLDAIGVALWSLLADAISVNEAADLLRKAFPGCPQPRLRRDIDSLFAALHASGLIALHR